MSWDRNVKYQVGPDNRAQRIRKRATNPGDRRWHQTEFFPVAQGRGSDTGALRQLADSQMPVNHLDFKRT